MFGKTRVFNAGQLAENMSTEAEKAAHILLSMRKQHYIQHVVPKLPQAGDKVEVYFDDEQLFLSCVITERPLARRGDDEWVVKHHNKLVDEMYVCNLSRTNYSREKKEDAWYYTEK